ncbi:MAG: hypothetical protein GX160_04430 [Clostridiales bacterium]|nr:hypothetical protein [Clostridiales bacterium]
MYYSQQDLDNITKQLIKAIILLGAIFLVFLVISIFVANSVANQVGMLVMLVGVCIAIFFWGMYVNSVYAYYKYIKDLVTGRSREIQGLVKAVSDHPVYKDNKLFYYEVTIEEDEIERVLLLDDQKDWPKINTDKLYKFEIHENYVKDFHQIP